MGWIGNAYIISVISLILLTGANFDISFNLMIWTGTLLITSYLIGYFSSRNYFGEIFEQFSILFNFLALILFLFFALLVLFL